MDTNYTPSGGALGGGSPRAVVIVGAGLSGLALAIRLKDEGVEDFTLLDAGDEVGGTWRDNSYPGAVCDVQSRLYSYSFEPSSDWTRSFAPQGEILDYLKRCTDRHDVRRHIHFGITVTDARFDEQTSIWVVKTRCGRVFRAKVLVSACGGLVEPSYPDIRGLESFDGPLFHTARYRHDVPLAGRNVAVIGTGASAIQVIPAIAEGTKKLYVFQRSAPWVLPKKNPETSELKRAVFRLFPITKQFERWLLYWRKEIFATGFLVDQRLLKFVENLALRHLAKSVPDPALRERLMPSYRIGCKRILLSEDYYPALRRDNVELVTDEICEIRPGSIVTGDGAERCVDAIIAATGFEWTEASVSFAVRGREGRHLVDVWRDGAVAYLGTAVAGFPNLFLLLGPNTWVGHTSMVLMIEAQAHYLVEAIKTMRARRLRSLEVRVDAQAAYNRNVQRRLSRTIWSSTRSGWCHKKSSKETARWPGYTFEFQRLTRRFELGVYDAVR